MPASRKRKRKALLKRECPCCSAILSEKTIERHLGGKHLPTRIQVTHSQAYSSSHKRRRPQSLSASDSGNDLSTDISSGSSISSDIKFTLSHHPTHSHHPDIEPEPVGSDSRSQAGTDKHLFDSHVISPAGTDTEEDNVPKIVKDTWSGRRSHVEDYHSDSEDDDFNKHTFPQQGKPTHSASESDSEFEWNETGMRNGLEMEDLVNEDFERIIAQFGAFPFYFCFFKLN